MGAADISNSPKKLGESDINLTENNKKSNTPAPSSEILKQNKEPAIATTELNTIKSKRIEIKLTTTEFKKQSELPEISKMKPPPAATSQPLPEKFVKLPEKLVKLPEKLVVVGGDEEEITDTLEINYKPEKSKWETDEEGDQDHDKKKSLQNNSKTKKSAEQQPLT